MTESDRVAKMEQQLSQIRDVVRKWNTLKQDPLAATLYMGEIVEIIDCDNSGNKQWHHADEK